VALKIWIHYAKVQAIKDQGLLEVDYHDPQYGIKFSFANELIFLPFDSSEFELGEKLGLGDLHDLGAYDVVYDVGEKVNLAFGKEEVSAINPLLDIDETIIFNLRKEIAAQKAEIGIVEETEAVIESEEDNGKVKTIFGEF